MPTSIIFGEINKQVFKCSFTVIQPGRVGTNDGKKENMQNAKYVFRHQFYAFAYFSVFNPSAGCSRGKLYDLCILHAVKIRKWNFSRN